MPGSQYPQWMDQVATTQNFAGGGGLDGDYGRPSILPRRIPPYDAHGHVGICACLLPRKQQEKNYPQYLVHYISPVTL